MSDPNRTGVTASKILFGKELFLIAGPCVVEDKGVVEHIASSLSSLCKAEDIRLIFKASYRKANRSALDSFTGIGDKKALEILANIREKFQIPVVTDIHSVQEVDMAAPFVDILQIPAFLCRQTDILVAAAKKMKPICVKKGQFMSPESMAFAVDKIRKSGNEEVVLVERGNSFGYNDLIVDFRAIPIMQQFDVPVVMDCTHALQKPNQNEGVTGGTPSFIDIMARAAVAVGANGLFIETHPEPGKAKSDGANMLPLAEMEDLLRKIKKIKKALDD